MSWKSRRCRREKEALELFLVNTLPRVSCSKPCPFLHLQYSAFQSFPHSIQKVFVKHVSVSIENVLIRCLILFSVNTPPEFTCCCLLLLTNQKQECTDPGRDRSATGPRQVRDRSATGPRQAQAHSRPLSAIPSPFLLKNTIIVVVFFVFFIDFFFF